MLLEIAIAALVGAALALRFQVYILLPTALIAIAIAIAVGVSTGAGMWWIGVGPAVLTNRHDAAPIGLLAAAIAARVAQHHSGVDRSPSFVSLDVNVGAGALANLQKSRAAPCAKGTFQSRGDGGNERGNARVLLCYKHPIEAAQRS